MKKLIILFLLLVSTNVLAWNMFGPSDYDECILENMKGVDSEAGANLVNKSCRNKFKNKVIYNSQPRKWTVVSSDEEGGLYEDKSSIKRYGKIVTVDQVIDLNKVQIEDNIQWYSMLIKREFDCANMVYRELNIEIKSDHMGNGHTIDHYGAGENKKMKKDDGWYIRNCIN